MSSTSNTNNANNRNVATYTLAISNFSEEKNVTTSSLLFGFPQCNGTRFSLHYHSYLWNLWGQPWASVSVQLSECHHDTVEVKHRMWIMSAKGEKCHTQEGISIFKKDGHNALYCISRAVLEDSTFGLLVNDTLTIKCEIELVNGGVDLEASSTAPLSDLSALSDNFEALLNSTKNSDVLLQIGNKKFCAHKLVLSARSPVFAAMFSHPNTMEAQKGCVKISDVRFEVFDQFLRYIYTGKLDGSLDRFAPELLATAEKYQMNCLKTLCGQYISTTLTNENVSELLIHADLYRAEALKCKCIEYIIDNSEEVTKTKGYTEVLSKKADLVSALFEKLSIKYHSK